MLNAVHLQDLYEGFFRGHLHNCVLKKVLVFSLKISASSVAARRSAGRWRRGRSESSALRGAWIASAASSSPFLPITGTAMHDHAGEVFFAVERYCSLRICRSCGVELRALGDGAVGEFAQLQALSADGGGARCDSAR